MERSSKIRQETAKRVSEKQRSGSKIKNENTESPALQEVRGRSLNKTMHQGMTQGITAAPLSVPTHQTQINLPQIQLPQASALASQNFKHGSDGTKLLSSTLEIRSKEAQQALLMNQSMASSFKNSQVQTTAKDNYFPNLVQNSSPSKKPDSSYENQERGVSINRERQNPMNMTRSSFAPAVQSNIRGGKQTHSMDPITNRTVQFREESLSADHYNALVQVINSGTNTVTNHQPMASVFGNYMMKVVQSVERRKKKQISNVLALTNGQNQKVAALVDTEGSAGSAQFNNQLDISKRYSQMSEMALQNFTNQIIPGQSAVDIKRKLGGSKVSTILDAYHESQKDGLVSITDIKKNSSLVQSQSDSSAGDVSSKRLSHNQVAVVGFHSVFSEPKATEQVAFLLKEAQRKDKIFIPLERAPEVDSGLMYKEMKNAPDNHGGIVVFSKQGFVTVGKAKNATSEFISNENFIADGVNKYILKDIPFFKKFHAMRLFKQWKYIMKWNAYTRKRLQLANSLHLAKPIFSERYQTMIPHLNNIRTLPFIDIKHNVTYGKKQQQLLEDNCTDMLKVSKGDLTVTLKAVKEQLDALKEEILHDDQRFEYAVKERRMMEVIKSSKQGGGEDLIMFSKERRQKEQEEEQFKIQKQRHTLFDKFVQFVLKICTSNLLEAQYENKRIFKEVFRDQKLGPQFEVSICFNDDGFLDSDPTMKEHEQSFLNVFSNIEVAIYQNQDLIDFINDLIALLFTEKQLYYKNMFGHMKKTLNENEKHQDNHNQIFDVLAKDISRCKEYQQTFKSLQEIYDFANDWETNQRDKQVSLEMSFYKETWMEMAKFAAMVEDIPSSNIKLGTILVESLSLKKYLAELPKRVIDSIRNNVTNTMETETKSLREELSKTSEILDQLPGSLNVYVEQVNTLKYVKEKQEEFNQKFSTINMLHQLCKQDNIKVSLNLQQAIEETSHLYQTLPKLQKRAQDGLNSNKDTMEKIMHSSSLVLSKKIKAFEKKYVETYLQDRSRIEDCADTLEELFKRSKAIHEIRSKVILYKEFLKLLYEEDPNKDQRMQQNKLQCSEDYEFVSDLHKQTIKLWKMLLYWRKRRHMCYNTPFLTLDTNKIIRSINKINRYFDEKLQKNDFLKEKSRPLYKVVMLQVKETSLIIEFLKDLRRESLQARHWIQIFTLIKAPHLKNSVTFTIINLREYHIQNYRDDIGKIIEHANTELKYERVFRSIKEEWDKHELKIIPFKETMDSYILVNTETLSTAIEENLTTLENISQSQYAVHIKSEIEEQVKLLQTMVKNLEIWVNAQHYWINLDPILQSSAHLSEILRNDAQGIGYGYNKDIDSETIQFLDLRNQFKRIMWSSFKNPKATYNLMIKTRIEVFEKLTKHFSVLQKKVHDFLDERRRIFPRFYFLSDNQFLEFLTLANSNQDFNEYINMLFQGAHKLFINRNLGDDPMKDSVQLENYIQTALLNFEECKDSQAVNIEPTPNLPQKGGVVTPIKQNDFDKNSLVHQPIEEDNDDMSLTGSMMSSDTKRQPSGLKQESPEKGGNEMVIQESFAIQPVATDDPDLRKSRSEPSKNFEVLGMISLNKELFLFERAVPMIDGVEKWLVQVEKAMQETISKQLSYAVSSFPNQALDEWVLDYPQQITLTTLHLILSHEINEILEALSQEDPVNANGQESSGDYEEEEEVKHAAVDVGINDLGQNRSQQRNEATALAKAAMSSLEGGALTGTDDDDPGMVDYIKRKNELKEQQKIEEEEARKRQQEENRRKFEEMNELPRDPEQEKRSFVDEMFGRDFPLNSKLLAEEYNPTIVKDDSITGDQLAVSMSSGAKTMELMTSKKKDFKEAVMTNLIKKSLQGLNLRIHLWVNQVIKSLYQHYTGLKEKQLTPDLQLHSIQQVVLKNVIAFLLYQRDIVDTLINKNVSEIDDFEWQSQIRLFWTGAEPQCKVLCGGWSVCQQNEYLGTQPRLTLTPLTNKYFVFISSTLREKSAVLINNQELGNSGAGDIFEEFSNLCMTPFKKIVCNPILSLKSLLKSLNGAALASFWVFYENVDKLQTSYIQVFNKEIQMLQQQFIISELSGNDQSMNTHNLIGKDIFLSENTASRRDILENTQNVTLKDKERLTQNIRSGSQLGGDDSLHDLGYDRQKQKYFKTASFGIFATFSRSSASQHKDVLLKQFAASFRVLSLSRFNERVLFTSILKTEGYLNYQILSKLAQQFLAELYSKLFNVSSTSAAVSDLSDEKFLLSLRDLRLVVKLSNIIREQESKIYYSNVQSLRESQMNESIKLMYAKTKKKEQRVKEREFMEKDQAQQVEEERNIEIKSLQEGLRLVARQKIFSMQAATLETFKDSDQYGCLDKIEKLIQECMEKNFEATRREYQEDIDLKSALQTAGVKQSVKPSGLSMKQRSSYTGGPLVRKKSISNDDVSCRFSSNVGLTELKHNTSKVSENKIFIAGVTKVLKDIIERLNFHKSNPQLRNCINVLDYFRRTKAIAFVGPVCTGKTSILKIVSNALHIAFKVKLRTSVVNTATMSAKDLYGSIEAFEETGKTSNKDTQGTKSAEAENGFSKSGIFKIILDVFDKERQTNNSLGDDKLRIIQSIFFDSCNIDQPLSECLLDFIEKTNTREVLSNQATEFMMDFSLKGEIKAGSTADERIPVVFPNGNVLQFPTNLFLFFETTSLKDASPPFISKVGLIVTAHDDLSWQSLFQRQFTMFFKKQASFFEDAKFANPHKHIQECSEEFLLPFIDKLVNNQRITQWEYFNSKAATLQLFNLLNCVFYKLQDIVKQRRLEEDEEYLGLLLECEKDVFWSNILLCTVWSYGAGLSKDLRKPFEETFVPFKRKFNINMSSSATAQSAGNRSRFTLFDIYYDQEQLQWELLQENIDYKLKLQYDPLSNQLLIPTSEVSQCFFVMDHILGTGTRYEDNILDNKHVRLLGPSGSGKTFIMNSFLRRVHGEHKFQLIQVPMSAYVTIERIKDTVEAMYYSKRRNLLEPRDKERPVVLIIDDVHLQSNLNVNILEFIRTWCMSKGYYDIKQGFFKGVGHFTTVTAENCEYRKSEETKFEGREPLNSRFLFYTNTMYLDEYDSMGIDRYKVFAQQWLTSKMWSTSKLINKFYILIANTIIVFLDKIRRIDSLHYSTRLRLTSFHFFQRFCSNLVAYSVTMEDTKDMPPGTREEDVVANLMTYEAMRMYGDRILKGSQRNMMLQKFAESFRQEFVGGNNILTPAFVDGIILGNYHDRLPSACIKQTQVHADKFEGIKQEIRQRVRSRSNNHLLEAFLEAPNSVKEIFKLSRILFKDLQHLIMIGPAGGGKLEYLQLAAILNDAIIFELNCARLCEAFKFIQTFKKCVISAVSLNKGTFILINEIQLRDPIYIDFVQNFMNNMCNKFEVALIWGDLDFKQSLIKIERDLYNESSVKRAQDPTDDQLLIQAMRKMQKNVHIVLMIDDYQTYFEWISLFPGLESSCEIAYIDELSNEGYRQFSQKFYALRGTDNVIYQEPKLLSALVELRTLVKNSIVGTFFSPQMLKNTCSEDYMITSLTEFIMKSEEKLNGYMYADGDFRLSEHQHRQYNYNLPVSIQSLYQTRYVMFLELFRFLYDYLGMSLVVRRNYYEAFLRKASEFSEFFKDIKVTKSQLHGQAFNISFKVASLKDRIVKIRKLLNDKENIIVKQRQELKETELELALNQAEVDRAMTELDVAINGIIQHLEKVTGSEFLFVLSQFSKFTDQEVHMLDIIAIIIEKDSKQEGFNRREHSFYFTDRDELLCLLDDRRYYTFDEPCLEIFKDFVGKWSASQFKDKPLFKYLYLYIQELYKKLNLRHKMSQTYSNIQQLKAQRETIQFALNYSLSFVRDKTADLNEQQINYSKLFGDEKDLSMMIEEAEMSHMRTEHIIEQIEKYCLKMITKLQNIKKRIETLLGDSLILASSVVFLGVLSLKERKQVRKEMAEYLSATTGGFIKCGTYWTEKGGVRNSRLLRTILKEYGLVGQDSGNKIISHLPSGILSQDTLVESIFTLLFAPSCPFIVDPSGHLQEFLSTNLVSKMQIKKLYASDQGINMNIEQIFRGSTFATLNDLNDCSSSAFGLSQDESHLTRLSHATYNGFEHDPALLRTSGIQSILQSVHTTFASVNKRISVYGTELKQSTTTSFQGSGGDALSLYQVQVFSPRFDFTLNSEYMARATLLVSIDDDEAPVHPLSTNSSWVDIKELMLKHFLPEECKKLKDVKERIKRLEAKRSEINRIFESAFLVANQETLQKLYEYSILKQSVEDIKLYEEEKKALNDSFQNLLQDHPLLSSYANVISIMFQSLKKLSKITGEITYSWSMFIKIVDQVLHKTIRELTNKLQMKHNEANQQSSTQIVIDTQGRLTIRSTKHLHPESYEEFTLDEEFFSIQVIPQIYGIMQASFKQTLISLYNLIYAVKLAYKKKEISEEEIDYFFKQLFLLKNFETWRNLDTDLVNMNDKVEKIKFLGFKRDLIKIYPEQGRKVVDAIEREIGQSFPLREASRILNFRIFNEKSEFAKLKLFEKLNIGFICPDHEFKTRLTQLVYEQLSSVFQFSEIPMRLHDFVKQASWTQPIALIPLSSINTINSVCSVASYYGIGLEILRTSDSPSDIGDNTQEYQNDSQDLKVQIESHLIDYSNQAQMEGFIKDAATYQRDPYSDLSKDTDKALLSAFLPKVHIDILHKKERLRSQEKAILGAYKSQNPLEIIQRSAIAGNWVFISSLRFPSYWHKITELLDRLYSEGQIKNTFRLFLDLQNYTQNEIPDSFLFNHAVTFHLTQKNNSDQYMENLQDIWSTVFDQQVLSQLTDYQPAFADENKTTEVQEAPPAEQESSQISENRMKGGLTPSETGKTLSQHQLLTGESRDNILKQQAKHIKDQKQIDLYNQFMTHQQPQVQLNLKHFKEEMKSNDAFLDNMRKEFEGNDEHPLTLEARDRARTRIMAGINTTDTPGQTQQARSIVSPINESVKEENIEKVDEKQEERQSEQEIKLKEESEEAPAVQE